MSSRRSRLSAAQREQRISEIFTAAFDDKYAELMGSQSSNPCLTQSFKAGKRLYKVDERNVKFEITPEVKQELMDQFLTGEKTDRKVKAAAHVAAFLAARKMNKYGGWYTARLDAAGASAPEPEVDLHLETCTHLGNCQYCGIEICNRSCESCCGDDYCRDQFYRDHGNYPYIK